MWIGHARGSLNVDVRGGGMLRHVDGATRMHAVLLYGFFPWCGACTTCRVIGGARVVGRRSVGEHGVMHDTMFTVRVHGPGCVSAPQP